MRRRRYRALAAPGHVDGIGCTSGEPYTLQPRPVVLLLGDSITQQSFEPYGWASALAGAYARERNADVLNRGFSGYTSRLLLRILPSVLSQLGDPLERVGLVTLLIGSNDATRPGAPQHVPLAEFTENVRRMLAIVRARLPNARILVITPPPVSEEAWAEFCQKAYKGDGDGRSNERLAAYVEAVKALARQAGAELLDLHACGLATPSWRQRLLSDGLHLSAGGNQLLFERLSEALLKEPLHKVAPGCLPWHMPRHTDIRAL